MKSAAYPPLDGLVDLACRDGVDIRPTLLRVLTDLYVQQSAHTPEEEVQYIELALGLIDSVDAPTREAVRTRLTAYSAAPAAVLARLRAPASSVPPVSPQRRSDNTSPENLAMAFFMAGTDERRLILASIAAAAEPKLDPPAPASSEILRQLEAATLKRDAREAAKLLEHALAVSADIAARIVRDRSGEPILIAAKALGMKSSMLQRVLLFLNPSIGQSVERVYDLARLYDEITMGTAAHMLAIWRDAGPRRRQQHAPVYWDDEQRGARSTATPVAASRKPAAERGIVQVKG
jgi:hypothetical protein